jgi:PEP-CTERM motif
MYRLSVRSAVAIVAIVVVQFTARPASASSILFSNLGLGNTYHASEGWSVGMPPSNPNWEVAASFVPSITATLDEILVPFADVSPNFGLPPSTLRVSIQGSDASGLPGSLLESFLYQGPFGSLGSALLIALASVSHPLLLADVQYWIVAENPEGMSGAALGWSVNSTGDTSATFGSTRQGSVDHFSQDSQIRDLDVAFAVDGTPVLTPVPEPATLALTAFGLIATVTRYRRARSGSVATLP